MKKLLKGLGLAGAFAGLAAFFLGTKKGQEMTKQAMTKTEAMLNEVTARLKAAGEVTEEKYHQMVETVTKEWEGAKKATTEEVTEAKLKLAGMWNQVKSKGDQAVGGHHCDHC